MKQKIRETKGFTLVEVIVVLIIIAIMAAMMVPKLTGWIDESKKKVAITQGSYILKAAQAAVLEASVMGGTGSTKYNNPAQGKYIIWLPRVSDSSNQGVVYKPDGNQAVEHGYDAYYAPTKVTIGNAGVHNENNEQSYFATS